jgi:hypothetical protein
MREDLAMHRAGKTHMKQTKVFCVGFHKTGTSSLHAALDHLGYRCVGYDHFRDMAERPSVTREEVLARAIPLMQEFDAAKDSPWPVLYKELDAAYPGSKFIHVERDPQSWINSAVRDFADYPNAIRQLVYGYPYPKGHEIAWLERYARHNDEVRAHFADRPEDFLSLQLSEIGWGPVCAFLGEPEPGVPWPHANQHQGKTRRKFMRRLKKAIRLGY